MQQQLANFIAAHNGTYLNYADTVPNQCLSVANAWKALLGFGVFHGNAIDVINQASPGFTRINNIPGPNGNAPVEGDIVVFGPNSRQGTGVYGDVALVISADLNQLVLFGQDVPYGAVCKQRTSTYDGVIGWLHPNTAPPAPAPAPAPTPSGAGVYPVKSIVNVRTAPHVNAPIIAQLHVGTVQITGIVAGDTGTVGTQTSSSWGITLNGHYFNMAATQ